METKDIIFGEEARARMFKGANILVNAVKVTLGPRGRNVVIKKKFTAPHITKDGVSVAKEVVLKDEFEDIGAQLVLEASSKTNEMAGDGTTTSAVIAQAILAEGNRYINNGSDPMDIKRGLDMAVELVTKMLPTMTTAIVGVDDLVKVATISANSDPTIGKLISDAIEAVGTTGIISIERGGHKDSMDIITGMRLDTGWLSQSVLTNKERMVVEYDRPSIVLVDKELSSSKEVLRVLEISHRDNVPVILIAHKFSDEVLEVISINVVRNNLKVCPIEATGYGDRRTDILNDIAAYTNASVFSSTTGLNIEGASERYFGVADKISVSREQTSIIGGKGSKEAVAERVESINTQMLSETTNYAKDKLKERLANIGNGVALIKVGGRTEVEQKERKDRMDDAICAVKAAVEEGIVPGGGVALLKLSSKLEDKIMYLSSTLSDDQILGVRVLIKAMTAPIKQILTNASEQPDVIINKVVDASECAYGYDAGKRVYGNMFEMGIIDPSKVTRLALGNAVAVAGLMLTTEVVIGFDADAKSDNLGVYGSNDL